MPRDAPDARTRPAGPVDYPRALGIWQNRWLTTWPSDALFSFARPGFNPRGPAGLPLLARRLSHVNTRREKTTAVAVKIKLKRMGKIREPYYRIVVADARTKRDGRAIEEIGKYHPKLEPSLIEVDSDRVQHWLSVGAQPTDPVRHLLTITGDWQKFKGEPGGEGTLKVAEPKADKKGRYEELVKESLAAKETKETKDSKGGKKEPAKSGGRSRKSADAKAEDAAKADATAKADAPAKADATSKADAPAKAEAPAKADATAKADALAKADDKAKADAPAKDATKAEAEAEPKDTKGKDSAKADETVKAEDTAPAPEAAADGDGGNEA